MPSTPAKAALGSSFKLGNGASPEVFTTVVSVKKIGGPTMEVATDDTTAMDDGGNETAIATIFKGGMVSLEGNFSGATSQIALETAFFAKSEVNVKVLYGSTPVRTYSFAAIITKFDPAAEVAKAIVVKVDLKVTGAVTPS